MKSNKLMIEEKNNHLNEMTKVHNKLNFKKFIKKKNLK